MRFVAVFRDGDGEETNWLPIEFEAASIFDAPRAFAALNVVPMEGVAQILFDRVEETRLVVKTQNAIPQPGEYRFRIKNVTLKNGSALVEVEEE